MMPMSWTAPKKAGVPRPALGSGSEFESKPDSKSVGGVNVNQIETEIEAWERLDLGQLRIQWRNRWGRLAPASLPRGLLFRVMAHRLQADAFGDLGKEAARLLNRLAEDVLARSEHIGARETEICSSGTASEEPDRRGAPTLAPRGPQLAMVLKPGTLLTREWRGRIERVMALEKGFAWNGKTFGSLSGVALAITGVKWNGHRFFFGNAGRGAIESSAARSSNTVGAANSTSMETTAKIRRQKSVGSAAANEMSASGSTSSRNGNSVDRPNWRDKGDAPTSLASRSRGARQ